MHNFKELVIWKESMKLAKATYLASANFPQDERFGLTSQVRRSAVSVPSNIAEGAGRNSDKEFMNFLSISTGSSYELETQLLLSVDLGFVTEEEVQEALSNVTVVQKMLYRFQEQLKTKIEKR